MSRQEEIFAFISKELVPDRNLSFDPEQNLLEAGLDSVAMMELIVWLEDNYKITIDTEDLLPENFGTLNAMAGYVEQAGRAGQAGQA